MSTVEQQVVPDEIARAVILPASYADLEGVVYPACDWLRANAPFTQVQVEGYDPVWLVAKHKDIQTVFRDAELFHNADANIMLQPQAGDAFLRSMLDGTTKVLHDLSYTEPPLHGPYRAAVAHAFLPAQIRQFEPRFRAIAKEMIDRLLQSQDGPVVETDIVKSLTMEYPLVAVMQTLGVPPEDYDYMLELTQGTFGGDDSEWRRPDVEASPEAMAKGWLLAVQDAFEYIEKIRKDRQANPRDDLATVMATAKLADGTPLPELEQNHFTITVALAGHDTTNSAISAGFEGLARFPDQFAAVKADPGLIPGLVDEAIRWATPAKHFMRNATADCEVAGQQVRDGDRLMGLMVSGNFDEDVFPDPYRFDVTRRPNPHLSFAFGPHICLGLHFAKIEMRALFEEVIPRLEGIELAGEPKLKVSNFVSGFKSLPLRLTKA